jgi:hypothetical protein
MSSLYLHLKHLPENLPERYQKSHADKAWGILEFAFDDGFEQITLFKLEYNLLYFVRWYIDMHLPKLYRPFWLNDLPAEESISDFISRPINYNLLLTHQYVNVYLAPINLKRAFNNFEPIPRILIGRRSPEGENPTLGEISLAGRDYHVNHFKIATEYPRPKWYYRFDLAQYHHDSRLAIIQFLEEWQEIAPESARKEARTLFHQALDTPESMN